MIGIELHLFDEPHERISINTDAIGYLTDFEGTAQIFITSGDRGIVNLRETYDQVIALLRRAGEEILTAGKPDQGQDDRYGVDPEGDQPEGIMEGERHPPE